jgi:hypothetical protein
MGLRFRRRISILPGVRLNVSRSGVSTSIGRRGLWVTYGRGGRRTTVGLPGSGLSYTTETKTGSAVPTRSRAGWWWVLIVGGILAVVLLHRAWGHTQRLRAPPPAKHSLLVTCLTARSNRTTVASTLLQLDA